CSKTACGDSGKCALVRAGGGRDCGQGGWGRISSFEAPCGGGGKPISGLDRRERGFIPLTFREWAAMIGARPHPARRRYPQDPSVIPKGISDAPLRSDRNASVRH